MISPRRPRLEIGHPQSQFHAPLPYPHRLLLHEAERLSIAVIGARTGDLVQGLMEPLPLTLDFLLAR